MDDVLENVQVMGKFYPEYAEVQCPLYKVSQ
jgi:hypothetical protein